MKIFVEIDFETRSLADLKLCGAERYAEDPSTEVICLVYGDEVWVPGYPAEDSELWLHVEDLEVIFVAHNAAFEQAIWRHHMVAIHGFPPLPVERWDCTMASCAWKGMPLALDKARRALGAHAEKDKAGNKLTLSMSKVDRKTRSLPALTPDIRSQIIAYCKQDVVVEHEIVKRVGLISRQNPNERRVWCYDQTINQRGIRLDMRFVDMAQQVVEKASAPLLAEFSALTGLSKVGSPKVKDWCADNGVPVENLQKGTIVKLLEETEDDTAPDAGYFSLSDAPDVAANNPDFYYQDLPQIPLPDSVRRVLEIRSMLGSASVKKLKRMQACVGYDGRARGLVQYHAAHSGRWGGRLLQPQNFPRDSLKVDPERAVEVILSGDPAVVERELGFPAIECVARSLRHALIPDPGKVFLVGDYAQIEARIVLALAGQHDKCEMMAQGQDVYLDMACDIYGVPRGSLTKADLEKRQTGKNTVLGCGFQMGPSKFHSRYCASQPVSFAEDAIEAYRKVWAPKVPNVWYRLQEATLECVETGREVECYGVTIRMEGDWLSVTLHNTWQKLWYYRPHLGIDRFGGTCWKSWQSKLGKWIVVDMYGGLETENIVQ